MKTLWDLFAKLSGWFVFLYGAQGTLVNTLIHTAIGFLLLLVAANWYGFFGCFFCFSFLYLGGMAILLCQSLGRSRSDQNFVERFFKEMGGNAVRAENPENADKPETSKGTPKSSELI